jgi:peroxiredoxin Q/BCP
MRMLSLMAIVSLFLSCAAVRAADLQAGDQAPDFSLPGSDGRTYKLSDFKGKQAVVLAWFPRAFTSRCTRECKALRESGEKIRAFDVAHFAASTDSAPKNKEFAESLGLDYPILADPDKLAAKPYGVLMPFVGMAKRWTFYIGMDGKILFIDKDVNTATAGADIAARLAALDFPRKKS